MAVITEGTLNTTASATFDVAIPAHDAGDLLVLVAAKNQGTSSSPAVSTGGWTTDIQQPNTSSTTHLLAAHKTGDGSETTVRVTNMAGGFPAAKVYRVQGADTSAVVVGTPDYEATSGVSTSTLDVGTAASGDAGFVVVSFANTTSSPGLNNGYTLDESSGYFILGYKVLDSTDDGVAANWTTSRSFKAGLLVVKGGESTGTIAATLDDATMAASGQQATGTIATTLADATSTAAGVHSIAGTSAVTLADATMDASGEVVTGASGTVAVTIDGAAMEASGLHAIVGSIAVTTDDSTGDAAGTHSTVGTVAVTLEDATLSASGAITYTGTIAVTLADAEMAAESDIETGGQIATTLDDATIAAYGGTAQIEASFHMFRRVDGRADARVRRRRVLRSASPLHVTGTVDVTAGDATMAASGAHDVAGTVAVTLDAVVGAADGTVGVVGAGGFIVADATTDAAGTVDPAGTISIVLDDVTMSGAGEPEIAGTITITLADAETATAGFVGVTGTIAALADAAVSAITAGHGAAGSTATTLSNATMAALGTSGEGSEGLDLDASTGEYAWTAHASALAPTTELDIIVFAAADDWTPTANQALFAKWSSAGNQRNWGLHFNSGGNLVMNLSTNGSTTLTLVGTPSAPMVAGGAGYWIRSTWRSSDGATAIYLVEAADADEGVPTSWGTAIATGTRYAGTPMDGLTTARLTLGAINDGTSMNYSGLIRYAEVRHTIGGPAVWALDARSYPSGTETFIDSVGGRTVTVDATLESVPVGMPLGTETVNVGPTANVLNHTGIAYTDLPSQQVTKVITTAIANAQPDTEVTSDGVTRRVFERLNVAVEVKVTSTTPVLIRDSKVGRVSASSGADVWVEWTDIGYGYARSGDNPCAASTIFDGDDDSFGTTACWNGATTLGSGGDTITQDAGQFTGECTSVSASSSATKMTLYRCNMWGHTDASFTGGKVPGELNSLAEQTLIECWWHDYLWFPRDWSRRYQEDGGQSHCDGTKVNAGALLVWRRCRVDMWPTKAADYADLEGPYWRGPNWGKNPNNTNWPLQRTDSGAQKYLPVAFLINNQAGGISKNNLIEDCIISGPFNNFFQFGSKTSGTTYQQNITIRRNRFYSGVTAAGTTFVQPRTAFMSAPNNTPASYKWHWPTSGPDVNYGVDGNAITVPPKAGFLNDSSFTPT